MGLSSALGIGRSALAAYQAALQVVGQNIANAGTPGYTRASARLSSMPGAGYSAGQLGSGVRIDGIHRNISESLQARLRLAGSDKQSSLIQREGLTRVEGLLDPLGDVNLGSLLGEFFKSLSELQNNPESVAARGIVVSSADALVERIQDVRTGLIELRDDLNTDIESNVVQADELATRIADLNTQIQVAEGASEAPAAALRDERDRVLSELSELINITVREQPTGAVNVYVGSTALVQFGQSFGLYTSTDQNADGLNIAVVRVRLDNGPVEPSSGRIAGLIAARDTQVNNQLERLDSFTAGLIREVNVIHASGQGLQPFTSLTGVTGVNDPTLALTAADNGLPFVPRTGSFYIDVKDTTTGAVVRTQIHVDLDGIGADTSLNSLAADISANVPGVTATVLADGRLQLTAASGSAFTFAEDTSGTLAALGINTFFNGKDADTIGVNSLVKDTPAFLAAAKSNFAGDGSNATALSQLQHLSVASLGGASLNDYYNAMVSDVAVASSAAQSDLDASEIIFDSLTAQRESLSGVNLDEEAVAMISYQRAYEGAAQYMRVVDEMLKTLLTLVS